MLCDRSCPALCQENMQFLPHWPSTQKRLSMLCKQKLSWNLRRKTTVLVVFTKQMATSANASQQKLSWVLSTKNQFSTHLLSTSKLLPMISRQKLSWDLPRKTTVVAAFSERWQRLAMFCDRSCPAICPGKSILTNFQRAFKASDNALHTKAVLSSAEKNDSCSCIYQTIANFCSHLAHPCRAHKLAYQWFLATSCLALCHTKQQF